MQDLHRRSTWDAKSTPWLAGACTAALIGLLTACSVETPVRRSIDRSEGAVPGPPVSIVFLIHGDGGYRYQDTAGVTVAADEAALERAQRIAERNPSAEVFIFHQRPRQRVLFLFPLSDGECWVYRNGQLVVHETYDRSEGPSRFAAESALYQRHSIGARQSRLSVFVYCGHEIPELGGAGYDESVPARTFAVRDLVAVMSSLSPSSGRFDLAVLSTCYSGTPSTIRQCGSAARYIVASPDNLHLSYFDLEALEHLDPAEGKDDAAALARRFAVRAFARLTAEVQTAVSVGVYDVDRVQPYLRSIPGSDLDPRYTGDGFHRSPALSADRCDCAEIPEYARPEMHDGVEVFYRAARFGRSALRESHSGWECVRTAAVARDGVSGAH